MTNIRNLLITKHGSHLYNLANAHSDLDLYVVYEFPLKIYRPKKLAAQSITDESDTMKIEIDRFKSLCLKGVPQALEALYAPPEYWLDSHAKWPELQEEIKNYISANKNEILNTYKRTAMNFMHNDDFKKNRHAFRLIINASQFDLLSKITPNLSTFAINEITELAQLPWKQRKEAFNEMLFDTLGHVD